MLALLFFIAACQTPAGRSAGAVVDDATIGTKVKAKLFEDESLSGFAINADTFQGEVTLTGAVETSENITRAAEIAHSVDGVKRVNNMSKTK